MKKTFLLFIVLSLAPVPSLVEGPWRIALATDAASLYQEARACYADLKSNGEARQLRQSWENCIEKFDLVARKYARKDEGADAKYSLGLLYSGLAENSKNRADWTSAAKQYQSFSKRYSRNSMADDAYLNAAKILWGRLSDKNGAKANLLKILKFYKSGDRAGEAKEYLKAVETGVVPKEPADEPVIKISSAPEHFIIVIDPGHGGTDTGAVGAKGTFEKNITLQLSKKLAAGLKNNLKNAGVFLTRDNDKTISLDDRVRFANKKKADFFISVHANASTSKKEHGIQTYYLNNASDAASSRLARQENKSEGRNISDLEKIIATMIQNISTEESRALAASVQKSMVGSLSARYSGIADQKVRSALFYVLVGVKCPSILIETSYISNPKEEKRLGSRDYQSDVADAIADGMSTHLKKRKALVSI